MATIADPAGVPNSVIVQRIDAAGRVVGTLATMADDGTNGDVTGDGIYSAHASVYELAPGTVRLRVSAAFQGRLTRVLSAPVSIVVSGASATVQIVGQQPRFVVTIQPVGTVFNPPAAMTLPNVDGLAPRSVTEMYSYDHDLASFVAIGTGTVSDDGSVLVSDPGVGVINAGWHCGGDPNSVGAGCSCRACMKCNGGACVADSSQNGEPAQGERCKNGQNGVPVGRTSIRQCCLEALSHEHEGEVVLAHLACCNGEKVACVRENQLPSPIDVGHLAKTHVHASILAEALQVSNDA
jgi:hypothetical protein